MVGTATYTNEEIEYVLNCVLDNKRHEAITRGFQALYGRPLSPNQVRYLKNKYGTSPQFNCPLVNSARARANNPKRRRRRAQADKEASDEHQELSDAQIAAVEANGSSAPSSNLNGTEVVNLEANHGHTVPPRTNNTVAGLGIRRVPPIRRHAVRHTPVVTEAPVSYPPLCMPQTDNDWPLVTAPEIEVPCNDVFNFDFNSVQRNNVYNPPLNNALNAYQPQLDFNFNFLPVVPNPTPDYLLQNQWPDLYSTSFPSLPVPDLDVNILPVSDLDVNFPIVPELDPNLPAVSDLDVNFSQPYWTPTLPNDDPTTPMPPQLDRLEEQNTWTLDQHSQNRNTDPTLPLQLDSTLFNDTLLDPSLFNAQDIGFDDFVNPTLFNEPVSAFESQYNGWPELAQTGTWN